MLLLSQWMVFVYTKFPVKLISVKMCDCDWENLPSVVLLHLYQYLPLKDRIAASSSCKHWRDAFWFYPSWRKLHLTTARCHVNKHNFLIEKCSKTCRSLSITFILEQFHEVTDILNKWRGRPRLSQFQLVGSGVRNKLLDKGQFESSVYPFIEKCNNLSLLILSHVENPTRLASIVTSHSATLHSLAIGTLIEIEQPCIEEESYQAISNLLLTTDKISILQLEISWITDNALVAISNLPLQRFIVTIQAEPAGKLHLTNEQSWSAFHGKLSERRRHCEFRVTCYRMHSDDMTPNLREFFGKACLTSHVRFIYCSQKFQDECVRTLMKEIPLIHTIKTIWAISNPREKRKVMQHPYVICAWRFKHLRDMVLSGSPFDKYDLEGMARMRPGLRIHIAKEDITCDSHREPRLLTQSEIKTLAKALQPDEESVWLPMNEKRFNDATLPTNDREALALRQVYFDDFQSQ